MASEPSIRRAGQDDIHRICHVDTDASSRFKTIPALADLADGSHGPLPPGKARHWLDTGSILAVEDAGEIVGFVTVQLKDGVSYIAELSVLRSHQGRGLGSLLLTEILSQARHAAIKAGNAAAKVSLTTFADVLWNGPWYRKRGFQEVLPESIGPYHVAKARQDVAELARPGYRRCCMLWEETLDPGAWK